MKKLIFLFITTFIIASVFFSGYFVIQEVRGVGGVAGIDNDIDMNTNLIKNLPDPYTAVAVDTPINLGYMECFEQICFWMDTEMRGEDPFCIANWCEINDFEWCPDNFPPDGEYGCFTPQTPVLMADGKYKPIKDVKEGDWVLTKENEKSDNMVSAKVTETFEHTVNSYLIINNELKVTDIHPIFVNNRWKQARTIKLGNKLLNEKGQEVVVESLEIKRETIKVYNLEIEGYETYFAGGVYVHNKPSPPPPM